MTFVVSLLEGWYSSIILRVLVLSSFVSFFNLVFGKTSSDSTLMSILTLLSLISNFLIPLIIANPIENLLVGKGLSWSFKLAYTPYSLESAFNPSGKTVAKVSSGENNLAPSAIFPSIGGLSDQPRKVFAIPRKRPGLGNGFPNLSVAFLYVFSVSFFSFDSLVHWPIRLTLPS